jgi:exodeoxyribonuclease VII large subunit
VLPLDIGLVTSDGSAAYHDFVEELRGAGFGFQIHFVDARMQGVETELDVPRALARLARVPEVDVIVLIRGGGSRSDLIWFDKEKVARAVAVCPKPVITGIGHEIDLSVADLVAHTSRKTPTAAAQFLMEKTRALETALSEAARSLRDAAREKLDRESRSLTESARAWRESTGAFRGPFKKRWAALLDRLRASARRQRLALLEDRLKTPRFVWAGA